MTGQDEPISVESLIQDARQPVETTLKEQLRCLSIRELSLYNKFPDVETAYHQMRSKLPNESDGNFRSACHYIGNSLHHFSQERSKSLSNPSARLDSQATKSGNLKWKIPQRMLKVMILMSWALPALRFSLTGT